MGYDNILATIGIWFIVAQIIGSISLIFWVLQLIRLFKRKDKTAAISILIVGIILIFIAFIPLFWLFPLLWIPTVIALFLGRSPEEEEVKKGGDFWCGICSIKYQEDFLGGETIYEGKICRSCLGKKQRGETITPPTENKSKSFFDEPIHHEQKHRSNYGERGIMLRELSRKQSKKNGYLTKFIINLLVLQWLFPLITYLLFWIQLKDEIKAQALNNPGMGLTTEIPFSAVIKDFFKILTSETYSYGNHRFIINIAWKIGIILAFLLPLGIWIYNLVRFFSVKGEVERLETEIKAIDR